MNQSERIDSLLKFKQYYEKCTAIFILTSNFLKILFKFDYLSYSYHRFDRFQISKVDRSRFVINPKFLNCNDLLMTIQFGKYFSSNYYFNIGNNHSRYCDCVAREMITHPPKYPSNWKNALLDNLTCSDLLWDWAKMPRICLNISVIPILFSIFKLKCLRMEE